LPDGLAAALIAPYEPPTTTHAAFQPEPATNTDMVHRVRFVPQEREREREREMEDRRKEKKGQDKTASGGEIAR
jgi:hypothetical protein